MKVNNINHKVLDLLMKLKIPEQEGRILIVLNKNIKGLKQKDISVQAYMYQPETSITLKILKGKEWVTIVERITEGGKGRPYAIYALKKPFYQILDEVKNSITIEYEQTIKDIERLKKIVSPKELYNTKIKKV